MPKGKKRSRSTSTPAAKKPKLSSIVENSPQGWSARVLQADDALTKIRQTNTPAYDSPIIWPIHGDSSVTYILGGLNLSSKEIYDILGSYIDEAEKSLGPLGSKRVFDAARKKLRDRAAEEKQKNIVYPKLEPHERKLVVDYIRAHPNNFTPAQKNPTVLDHYLLSGAEPFNQRLAQTMVTPRMTEQFKRHFQNSTNAPLTRSDDYYLKLSKLISPTRFNQLIYLLIKTNGALMPYQIGTATIDKSQEKTGENSIRNILLHYLFRSSDLSEPVPLGSPIHPVDDNMRAALTKMILDTATPGTQPGAPVDLDAAIQDWATLATILYPGVNLVWDRVGADQLKTWLLEGIENRAMQPGAREDEQNVLETEDFAALKSFDPAKNIPVSKEATYRMNEWLIRDGAFPSAAERKFDRETQSTLTFVAPSPSRQTYDSLKALEKANKKVREEEGLVDNILSSFAREKITAKDPTEQEKVDQKLHELKQALLEKAKLDREMLEGVPFWKAPWHYFRKWQNEQQLKQLQKDFHDLAGKLKVDTQRMEQDISGAISLRPKIGSRLPDVVDFVQPPKFYRQLMSGKDLSYPPEVSSDDSDKLQGLAEHPAAHTRLMSIMWEPGFANLYNLYNFSVINPKKPDEYKTRDAFATQLDKLLTKIYKTDFKEYSTYSNPLVAPAIPGQRPKLIFDPPFDLLSLIQSYVGKNFSSLLRYDASKYIELYFQDVTYLYADKTSESVVVSTPPQSDLKHPQIKFSSLANSILGRSLSGEISATAAGLIQKELKPRDDPLLPPTYYDSVKEQADKETDPQKKQAYLKKLEEFERTVIIGPEIYSNPVTLIYGLTPNDLAKKTRFIMSLTVNTDFVTASGANKDDPYHTDHKFLFDLDLKENVARIMDASDWVRSPRAAMVALYTCYPALYKYLAERITKPKPVFAVWNTGGGNPSVKDITQDMERRHVPDDIMAEYLASRFEVHQTSLNQEGSCAIQALYAAHFLAFHPEYRYAPPLSTISNATGFIDPFEHNPETSFHDFSIFGRILARGVTSDQYMRYLICCIFAQRILTESEYLQTGAGIIKSKGKKNK